MRMAERISKIIHGANESFSQHYAGYWSHLSRFTNLLIIANISLFFLTELVTKQSYYFTFYSLF